MRYRVLLLALSYALCGPVQSAAQDGPALKAPPPEASQFDFLVGEWTVDVTSKAPGTPPQYHGVWRAAKTLNGLGVVDEYGIVDDSNRVVYSGTTLRVFDTKAGKWTMRLRGPAGGKDWSMVGARGRQRGTRDPRGAAGAGPGRPDHHPEDSVLQHPAAPLQLGGGSVERRRRHVGTGLLAPRSHAPKQNGATAVMSQSRGLDRRSSGEVPEIVHGFLTAGGLLPARPYSVNFRAI